MDTKELLNSYVKERTSNIDVFPDIVNKGIETISGEVPDKLKIAIALSELITFAGHLRKPIMLSDGQLVPVNAITFALSASGTSKDKSLNSIRKALGTAYDHLEEERTEFAKEKARNMAILEGDTEANWSKYYVAPKPLQAGLGTVEGLMHHFADIAANKKGAGSVLSTEIGAELQTNGNMTDIIKIISVAYDLGNIPPKIVKSHENQTAQVKGLPVNALFFGAQEGILYNNDIKNKFRLVFSTQLARRSIFTFTPEMPDRVEITSIDQLYELREKERIRVSKAYEEMDRYVMGLVHNTTCEPLELSDEAVKLFDVYLEYNSFVSEEMSNKFPISKLSRKHKQWLALKIAGAYAILQNKEYITEGIYAYAINTVEYLSNDLMEFEKELIKEPYEQLCDLCKMNADEGEYEISLHDLRKLQYISGGGASGPKVSELATLANSYDNTGSYTSNEHGIKYQEIVKTDIVGVSYKIFETTSTGEDLKSYMARNCKEGFEFYETNFEEIALLLEENAAYGPFQFTDGERNKDNVTGSTKFVVMDIDKSYITDYEAHELLNDYNHYVVRTSDAENEFKFRVLVELDAPAEMDERLWKLFVQDIADFLGLTVDSLPQSQIFLSFKGREILSQLEGRTLKTKQFINSATAKLKDKPKDPKKLPQKIKDQRLEDPRTTFSFAFEAEPGERSRCIYRALAYAIDLGADEEYLKELAYEINDYMVEGLDEERLERTLLVPALRRL